MMPRPDTNLTLVDPTRSSASLAMTLTSSFTSAPDLDSLTLAHILNGETCPPISFPDFAAFVSHKEFTTENLLFVIWFRSYRDRFNALPRETRDAIPVPSARMGDRYYPFKYLDGEVVDGVVGGGREDSLDGVKVDFETSPSPKRARRNKEGDFQRCAWTVDGKGCSCGNSAVHRHGESKRKRSWFTRRKAETSADATTSTLPYNINPILNPATTHPSLPPPGTTFLPAAEQPLRFEAERAFTTFLQKGGPRELGISDELRVYARDTLNRSTAPNCFLPIFDEIYHTVETQSMPHFLSEAKSNINRPKQLYWYFVGLGDLFLGILIFVLLTLFVPERNFGYRIIRIPVILFTSFGSMQIYSAYRGFCSQTWGRSSRQVRPWELDTLDEDEEAAAGGREMAEVEGLPLTALAGLGLKGLNGSSVEVGGGSKRVSEDEGVDEKVEARGTEMEITLPDGVHPLGAYVSNSPTETAFVETPYDAPYKFGSSASPTSPTSPEKWQNQPRTSESDDGIEELTEVQLRQLAIRRETIKVPAPDLAFPIADSIPVSPTTPNSGIPLFPTSPLSTHAFDNDISPFAFPDPIPTARTAPVIRGHRNHNPDPKGGPSPRVSIDAKAINGVRAKRPSAAPSVLPGHRVPADLTTLLVKFRRAEPMDPSSYKATEEDRERAMRIFGPERLIEDPRIRSVMSRTVKEILRVGIAVAVVTAILSFAVPMRLS